ncbi:hypothetical protein NDU88_007748 [Pleurodeles waltl]|uniref:Uncharacterized protein n=1 Tax=Pleurodeles waltl TaxID=8319 RepID=A0AAV7QQN8_PLEWA|nr:hypothetical protein NDU88_007748 [Pleurodeles waltl]
MSAERRLCIEEESRAANWIRAALELRRSHRAVARVPLRGIAGRGSTSTSCSAVPYGKAVSLEFAESQDPAQQIRKPVYEAGTLISTSSPARSFLATTATKANQAEIRFACESLENFFYLLALRTRALEESVATRREDLRRNKEEIQQLEGTEWDLQEKFEYLENNPRRSNLRILNVPEGVEGSDLKKYKVSLIKKVIPLDETEEQIFIDIQGVHRDPFRRNPTYSLKEKILGKALNLGSLETGEITFEIRSDLSRLKLNRQWELGKRLEE